MLARETEPLLAAEHAAPNDDVAASPLKTRQQRFIFSVICMLAIVAGFASYLEFAPQTKIFQDIVCREYYRNHESRLDIDLNVDCKIEPVQSEVAYIVGWLSTITEIPGFVLALPYGVAADRIGRRPVLILAFAGAFVQALLTRLIAWFPQTIPLRFVLLTPVFQVIGGGGRVLVATVYIIIADTFTGSDRTTTFFQTSALSVGMEVIAPPLSALLMDHAGDWLPYMLSLALWALGCVCVLAMPETLVRDIENIDAPIAELPDGTLLNSTGVKSTLSDRFAAWRHEATASIGFFGHNGQVQLLVFMLALCAFGKQSVFQLLLLYASKRLDLSIAQAGLLFSMRAGIYALFLIAVLPALSYLLVRRYHISPLSFDLYATRICALLITAGSFITGLATRLPLLIVGLVIFALGSSLDLTTRSVATACVVPSQVGTLYAVIVVAESAARCIANPLLAATFTWGMVLGNGWQGLPYFVAGGLFAVSFVVIMSVKVPKQVEDVEDES